MCADEVVIEIGQLLLALISFLNAECFLSSYESLIFTAMSKTLGVGWYCDSR
jgi:hypothetical protein